MRCTQTMKPISYRMLFVQSVCDKQLFTNQWLLASVPNPDVIVAPNQYLNSPKSSALSSSFLISGQNPLTLESSLFHFSNNIEIVSKMKTTPLVTIKDRCSSQRPQWNSSIKHVVVASSVVLASIHRRISKLFSILATIHNLNRCKSYKIIKKTHLQPYEHFNCDQEGSTNAISKILFVKNSQSPLISVKRTVFLDLDETLLHSIPIPPPKSFDFVITPIIHGVVMNFYVLKRLGLDEFLESLAAKFEVVVFTATMKEYVHLVLDRIDPKGLISQRFYRDSCIEVDGRLVKDLSPINRDLKQPLGSRAMETEEGFALFECCDDTRDAVKHYLTD